MSLFDDSDAVMILLAILVGGFLLVGVPVMAVIAYRRSNQLRDELIALRIRLEAVEQRHATVGAVSITRTDIRIATAVDPAPTAPGSAPVDAALTADPTASAPITELVSSEPPVPPVAAPASAPPEARTVLVSERLSLEQLLGARGFVWIGGLSIALAGAFFVKYSLDQGLLSPALRIAIGVLFGLVLLVAGEWMRPRSSSIAQALIAAGFADLFASFFAAHALYDLIPAPIDFALLAGVTAAGILAALRHGPFVGIVGMAGGFLTPALVSTDEPRPTALFVFLFLILFGALLLWRRRRWWYVAALGLVGSLGWAWYYDELNWVEADNWRQGEVQLPLFILAISALMIWTFDGRTSLWGKTGPGATPLSQIERLIDIGGNLIAAGFLGLWLSNGSYNLPDWAALIALMSLHLLAARRYPSREIIGFAVAALVIVVLATMPLMIRAIGGEVLIDRSYDIAALSLTLGALLVLGGYGLSFAAARPVHWSGLSVLASAALFAVVYIDFRHQDLVISWPLLCVLLAGLHLVFAERLYNKRGSELPYRASFALHCLAVIGFIAAGIPLQVGSGWIAVIWALLLPPIIWIADRLQEIWLRRVIWVAIPGILIALFLSGFPVGDRPILNWLLYGVGIPFLACIASGWLLRRKPSGLPPAEDLSLQLLVDLTAAFLGFLLISLEVRQFFHGHDLIASEFSMTEAATLAILWLAAAKVVVRLALRRDEMKLIWAALLLAIIGAAAVIIGPILVLNPLLNPIDIGHRPIFNQALYAFILPAICCLLVARSFDRARLRVGPQERDLIANLTATRMILGATALLAGFIGVSILNRQLFAGNIVVWPAGTFMTDLKSDAELYGYSLAWLGYGALLILLALATKSGPLRHAAAGVILLAVLKVFLIDAAGLTGLFRVASFLGLGVSLIAFGYLYQRFVLIKRA